MKGTIVGKEINPYTDKSTGEIKISRNLYVLCDAPKRLIDGFEGQTCECISVPFDLPAGVGLHSRCEFEFEFKETYKGSYRRLVDIEHIEKMAVSIKPITDVPNK